jgi:hypothetical protein
LLDLEKGLLCYYQCGEYQFSYDLIGGGWNGNEALFPSVSLSPDTKWFVSISVNPKAKLPTNYYNIAHIMRKA